MQSQPLAAPQRARLTSSAAQAPGRHRVAYPATPEAAIPTQFTGRRSGAQGLVFGFLRLNSASICSSSLGRSVMIPTTPQPSIRRMSSASLTVQTCTARLLACASAMKSGETTVSPSKVSGT
jgi:hypothetical protein